MHHINPIHDVSGKITVSAVVYCIYCCTSLFFTFVSALILILNCNSPKELNVTLCKHLNKIQYKQFNQL